MRGLVTKDGLTDAIIRAREQHGDEWQQRLDEQYEGRFYERLQDAWGNEWNTRLDLLLQGNNDGWLIEQIRNENYTLQAGNKRYELANHLGNVLAVVSDKKVQTDGVMWQAEVVSAQDYFPFGMAMPGRSTDAKHRYTFNGKETDPETGIQDYGMRWYLPNIARFPSVDPLTKKYPWNSTYAFAENDVIRCIDLEGGEKLIRITDIYKGGQILSKEENGDLVWRTELITITKVVEAGQLFYDNYANQQKYGKAGTLEVVTENWEGGTVTQTYIPEKRNIINAMVNETVAPLVQFGSTALLTPCGQIAVRIREGAHEGAAYDANNVPKWAMPYKMDDNWNLIPQQPFENLTYSQKKEEGKGLMNTAAKTIITVMPVAPAQTGGFLTKFILNQGAGALVKIPLKMATDAAVPSTFQQGQSQSSSVPIDKTSPQTN